MTDLPPPAHATADAPALPPKKKGRLWWKVLLGLALLLVLLVLFTPTLVSSRVGRPLLLGQVNKNIAGSVGVDELSLGWFSGTGARNFVLKDDAGNVVAKVSSLETNLSLWSVLTGKVYDLGKIVLRGDELHVVVNEDGSNNLSRALAGRNAFPASRPPADPRPAPPAGPSAPTAPPTPTAQSPAAKSSGPIVRADIDAQFKLITATAPNAPPLTLNDTALTGRLDTSGPLQLLLKTKALNPDKSAVAIAADAAGTFFDNGALKPLASLRGTGQLVVNDKLNIAPITPLLKASGIDLQLTGAFRGNAKLADAGGQQTASAEWEITDNPSATGELLKGDTLRLQQLSGNFNATLNADALDNMKLVIASNLFSGTCAGSIKTADLGAGKPLPPIAIQGKVNVTEMKRQLPKLLGSVPDTIVEANLTGALDLAKKTYAVAADSSVREVDPATGRGNALALTKGDVLSWGDVPNNATVAAEIDLERLQGILKDKLPAGTQIAGRHKMQLHLTGPIADGGGLRAFRKLSFARTSLAFDRVALQGVDLSRGELAMEMKNGVIALLPTSIPANGGSLNPHGRIDLNIDPPAYVHDQAAARRLGENLNINKEFAANWLQWLPLLWGNQALGEAHRGAELAQVAGLLNLQLDKAYIPLDGAAFKQRGTLTGTIDVSNLSTEAPFLADLLKAIGPVAKITQADVFTIRNGNIQPVTFSLENGRISYQNLVLGNGQQSLRFSGSVGLDLSLVMNMDLSLQASPTGGGDLGNVTRLLGGGRGGPVTLAIPVTIKGTIKKPEISVNPEAINRSLQNIAPGVLDNLLNRGRGR